MLRLHSTGVLMDLNDPHIPVLSHVQHEGNAEDSMITNEIIKTRTITKSA